MTAIVYGGNFREEKNVMTIAVPTVPPDTESTLVVD
jgi:hypothetical protein